jgi:hypothetical protein
MILGSRSIYALTCSRSGDVLAPTQDAATITVSELQARTQTLYDAVAPGDKSPWQRYLAEDVIIHDGRLPIPYFTYAWAKASIVVGP